MMPSTLNSVRRFALALAIILPGSAFAAQTPVLNGNACAPNVNPNVDSACNAFGKLNSNLTELYASIVSLTTALAGKAALVHTHVIGDVTGLSTALALLAPVASPAFTGVPTVPTAAPGTNTTQAASTSFVTSAVVAATAGVASFATRTGAVTPASGDYSVGQVTGAAPLASPGLTGTPTAPTASAGTNTTQIASTGFVTASLSPYLTSATAATTYAPILAGVPTGAVFFFAGSSCPSGALENDGAPVSRSGATANLFAAIGTLWGAGDGSTTFNKPDLRGYFVRGYDHGRGIDAGRAIASAQADMVGPHNHNFSGVPADSGDPSTVDVGSTAGSPYNALALGPASGAGSLRIANSTGAETRPKNVAMLSCIKF